RPPPTPPPRTGPAAMVPYGGHMPEPVVLPERRRLRGTIRPGGPDWVYLPVEVPAGGGERAARYRYDRPATPPGVPGNALDIGVFDETGFRGWSGGARDGFAVGGGGAPPRYPARPGNARPRRERAGPRPRG